MVFSSISFLYYFIPLFFILYFLTPTLKGSLSLKNVVLLTASLIFYAWGEPIYVFVLISQCVVAWGFGLAIEKKRGQSGSGFLLGLAVAVCLSPLLFFKYADFFLRNINSIFRTDSKLLALALPIGISFYTFQILSYLIDLHKGKIAVQKNVIAFSAYVAMFPQLVAGPIVRYLDVSEALSRRKVQIDEIALGIRRFTIGLGKKVLLANVFGEIVDLYKSGTDQSFLFTWLYLLAFSLQIYFDFSGYSDMAIGLGRIIGFRFPENFNYPYIAKSITDFWRRWHISLSSWFRDYVYIPLGGNRTSYSRNILNILIVWLLTGFWHGAEWNFIFWGLYFAVILLLERRFLKKYLDKLPGFLRHVYVILLLMMGWLLFDAANMSEAGLLVSRMIGISADGFVGADTLYYLRSYFVPLTIGIVACTPLMKNLIGRIAAKKAFTILEPLFIALLLITVTACLVDGSYNPFIYFRF